MYLIPSRTLEIPCSTQHDSTKLMLGLFITTGTVVSYVPQIVKIMQKKSSEGLSLYFFFLGAIGMNALVANVLILSFPSIICCLRSPKWGPLLCTENTFGVTQVSVQTFCFMTCVALFYIYYPPHLQHTHTEPRGLTPAYRRARWVGVTIVSFCAALFFTTLAILLYATDENGDSKTGTWVAGVLGMLATITSVLQFLPQLLHTWGKQSVGALSIPMMMMQTPGGFLMAYSLYIQPNANWTSWLPYLICGLLQGVLLLMCIAFTLRPGAAAAEQSGGESEGEDDGATEPLLGAVAPPPPYGSAASFIAVEDTTAEAGGEAKSL